jgi:glutathione S-transferase
LNPSQKIPVLQDQDLTLSESAAIVTYLAETYGGSSGLIPPVSTRERAYYYQWCFFTMMELDAHTSYVIRKHVALAEIYGEAPNAVRAAEEGFAKQAQVAGLWLARGGPFILGQNFTGADILLTTCLGSAHNRKVPLSEILLDYVRRMSSREAYTLALAANQRP